eukprot:2390302-Prymnesium_polylepis.1
MLGLRWADAAFPSAQDTGECAERSRSVAIPRARARYVFRSCAGDISGSFESWGLILGVSESSTRCSVTTSPVPPGWISPPPSCSRSIAICVWRAALTAAARVASDAHATAKPRWRRA